MAGTPYYGSIPGIAEQFKNDPRSKLAASMLAQGTSTAPVATGGWGVTDGLARAAQAITGALVNKNVEKKYNDKAQAYTAGLKDAAQLASNPQPAPINPAAMNPATANPGMAGPAAALGGQSAPPAPQMAPPAPMTPPPVEMPPQGGAGGPMAGMAGVTAGIPPVAPPPMQGTPAMGIGGGGKPFDYYGRAIRPIEGGTDPKTGAFRTSPKGAVGPGQIMPSTGPEAARLAGVAWDEKRFRSDTAYNDALGQAYFNKQLQDFGDPLKAAAAYNAGGGRVRRAIRQAGRSGQDFTAHLPAETRDYVAKFAAKIGGADAGGAPGAAVSDPTAVQAPAMEAVPQGPAMETTAPTAPDRPAEVQTNRIAMAQRLLASDNPDLAAIAQDYLTKGLDEQNAARTLASQQEQQQDQTGYTSALADFNSGRELARTDQYQQGRDARTRNYSREELANTQGFTARESAADRNFRGNESALGRDFTGTQNGLDRNATRSNLEYSETQANGRTAAQIEGKRLSAKEKLETTKNAYYDTPTGLKMRAAANEAITKNDETISKLERYKTLNEDVDTGGISGYIPFRGTFDSKYAEMDSLAKETTLGKIGGSLGTAISDGDRSFIEKTNVNPQNPKQANRNIAQLTINALKRKSDREVAFGEAQATGMGQRTFSRQWNQYVNETTVAPVDKKTGNVTGDYMPFEAWQQMKATGKPLRRVP